MSHRDRERLKLLQEVGEWHFAQKHAGERLNLNKCSIEKLVPRVRREVVTDLFALGEALGAK